MIFYCLRLQYKLLVFNKCPGELECLEEDIITIFPPEICNTDITDEDSSAENKIIRQNLPSSQLRDLEENTDNESSDNDDENSPFSSDQLK